MTGIVLARSHREQLLNLVHSQPSPATCQRDRDRAAARSTRLLERLDAGISRCPTCGGWAQGSSHTCPAAARRALMTSHPHPLELEESHHA